MRELARLALFVLVMSALSAAFTLAILAYKGYLPVNDLYFAAAIVLAIALGLALARTAAYKRALKRTRRILAETRAERDAGPVWTTGAPQAAIDAEFDELTSFHHFFTDGSDR